jgi:hypothetical protein
LKKLKEIEEEQSSMLDAFLRILKGHREFLKSKGIRFVRGYPVDGCGLEDMNDQYLEELDKKYLKMDM